MKNILVLGVVFWAWALGPVACSSSGIGDAGVDADGDGFEEEGGADYGGDPGAGDEADSGPGDRDGGDPGGQDGIDGADADPGDTGAEDGDAKTDEELDPCEAVECGMSEGEFCGLCPAGQACSDAGVCQPFSCGAGEACFPITPTGVEYCREAGANYKTDCPATGEPFYGQDANYPDRVWDLDWQGDVVVDNRTGLTWQRQGHTGANGLDFAGAVAYCEGLELEGHTNWRLPSLVELLTVTCYGCEPAVAFPLTAPNEDFWTSTLNYFQDRSLTVAAYDGEIRTHGLDETGDNPTSPHYVRCVREMATQEPRGRFSQGPYEGTIHDNVTGQTWGGATLFGDYITWEQALAYCEGLDLGGHEDWRLPDLQEYIRLKSLDQLPRAISLVTRISSDATTCYFWTSTPIVIDRTSGPNVWFADLPSQMQIDQPRPEYNVDFSWGDLTDLHRAMCVRP